MDEVERAFVHVDYAARDMPEHKVQPQTLASPTSFARTARRIRVVLDTTPC